MQCAVPLLILNLSGRRFKTSNAARSAYTCHAIAYIAPFPVRPGCSDIRFSDVTWIFFFFFQNRGAAHSKTPKVMSGFPISPDSGSSEAGATKSEVGKGLKSRELTEFNCSQLLQFFLKSRSFCNANISDYPYSAQKYTIWSQGWTFKWLFIWNSFHSWNNLINILHAYQKKI